MSEPTLIVTGRDGRTRSARLSSFLDPAAVEAAEREANAWIKTLRQARVDGEPFRDRFTYRGDSLWWFAELYLHRERVIVEAYRAIHALERLIEAEHPATLAPEEGGRLLATLGPQAAARHGVAWAQGRREIPVGRRVQAALRGFFYTANALADRLRPSPRTGAATGAPVAAFVHSAFWRRDAGEEAYIGPVLDAVGRRLGGRGVQLVGLGPRTNFRARQWRHRWAEFRDPGAKSLPLTPIETYASWRAIQPSLEVWRNRRLVERSLHASDDLRQAAWIGGYDAWPLLRDELTGISHLQFPWSARAMDEAAAALDALRPRAVVTYAEAGGWGRALLLEARRRGIPSVGLQHGFIYRHWLNYLHEPDEMEPSPRRAEDRGFPRPDLTLVYDRFAARHLREAGRFPETAIEVTGSARLEAFRRAGEQMTPADRSAVRRQAGAAEGDRLAVVAAKYTQIAPVFGDLVRAAGGMPGLRLLVKCHPAETAAPYERVAAGAANVRVTGGGSDLPRLIAAADLLVTVNSTAAIEAMALDVPALVLATPNNLSPFVQAGAMSGVDFGCAIEPALRAILYDGEHRERLRAGRRAFIHRYGIVPDGHAADRAAAAIVRLMNERVEEPGLGNRESGGTRRDST